MQPARRLIEQINRRAITTGILTTNHLWPELVELCMAAGLDYLIIDNEHGAHDPTLVADVCALGRLVGFPVLIRPIANDITTIRRTIDSGPCGMLLPTVQSAAMLDTVRDAIYLPPRGVRRPGGRGNRWASGIAYDNWKREIEDDFIILPQIETREGLRNVNAIAAHEIVTAMAIGPFDLSADLGVCGAVTGPEVTAAQAQIRDAAQAVGKQMWVIGNGAALKALGYTFLCIGEPTFALQNALKQANDAVKQG